MRLWSTLCACAAATAVAATAGLSFGQAMIPVRQVSYYAPGCVAPCDVMPMGPMQQPMPPMQPTQPDMAPAPEIQTDQLAGSFGAASGPASGAPHMIGDFLNAGHGFLPEFQGLNPYGVRSFKFSENQSAAPTNRIFINYNWFDDIGGATLLGRVQTGFEKTVGNRASLGMQVPVYFVDPIDTTFGAGTTKIMDVGDLVVFGKYVLCQSGYGDYLTLGAAYQIPTGPATIADVDVPYNTTASHRGSVQSSIAALRWLGNNWFVQGFVSADIPIDKDDAYMLFTDVGIGNYVPTCGRRVQAIIPTMEIHVNTPFKNRVVQDLNGTGPATFYNDQVNLTSGVTLQFNSSTLAAGIVAPIGNEDLWDYEVQVQWNYIPCRGRCY